MREILFEYGFESVNGIVKKVYALSEIPNIAKKCDVWNVLPIAYVRQFTGLTDKNGTKVFEGDVLKGRHSKYNIIDMNDFNIKAFCNPNWFSDQEVIGNIHTK